MCLGFFGIQFGWALQMGNMSAIYSRLGASEDQIPMLWLPRLPVCSFSRWWGILAIEPGAAWAAAAHTFWVGLFSLCLRFF